MGDFCIWMLIVVMPTAIAILRTDGLIAGSAGNSQKGGRHAKDSELTMSMPEHFFSVEHADKGALFEGLDMGEHQLQNVSMIESKR